jgi:hypothetical protein
VNHTNNCRFAPDFGKFLGQGMIRERNQGADKITHHYKWTFSNFRKQDIRQSLTMY